MSRVLLRYLYTYLHFHDFFYKDREELHAERSRAATPSQTHAAGLGAAEMGPHRVRGGLLPHRGRRRLPRHKCRCALAGSTAGALRTTLTTGTSLGWG